MHPLLFQTRQPVFFIRKKPSRRVVVVVADLSAHFVISSWVQSTCARLASSEDELTRTDETVRRNGVIATCSMTRLRSQ